jgi:Protein kinase domain
VTEVLRTVGRFELLQEVGRGGMAVVWLARQTDLDRKVALKELAPFHAADPAFAARFLRESRIAGGLNHPNIVTVHDYLEAEGVPFISMEYMEHGSLRPLVGRLSLAQVAYVLEGMLAGLAYAEQQGIVHRDLKPENVMVRADGQVKIADFGIAKAFNQASSSGFHTVTGTTVGTPAYMAPEQAMAKELGPWTDLYSTGIVAYELLVGQVPFSDTETPVAILLRHVNDPPPAPRSIKPDLDEGIEAWLLKMLSKNPADRYQHATDAWDALEEIIVTVAGPRWRRDARVLGLGGGTYTPTPMLSIPKIPTPPPVSLEPAPPPVVTPPPAEPPVAPPPPAATEPPAPAPAAAAAAATPPPIDAFAASDPLATAAPLLAPQADSFEWPALEPEVAAPPTKPEQPKQPVEPSVAPPPPPVDAFAASAPLSNAAPASQADSFEWPALEPEVAAPPTKPEKPKKAASGRSRRPLALIIGLLVLVGGAAVAYLVLGGGGNSSGLSTASTPSTQSTTTPTSSTPTSSTPTTTKPVKPLLPDPAVPAAKRASIIASGGTLFATSPGGRVARLNAQTLRQLATTSDASTPRALAVIGRTLIVADDRTLFRLRADTLAPVGASAFGPAPLLGGGGKAPLVAATGHRLCLVGVSGPGPCVRAAFAPTGVGASPGGTILAVDGAHGTLVSFQRSGKKLAPKGAAIPVGKRAHGPVVVVGTRAYVPVSRGLAIVDLASHRVTSTVPLQVTPGAPALVAGTLVAPLPARNGVALVSTKPGAKAAPAFVATGPLASIATAGSGSVAYVANGDGTVTLVDVAKAKALRRLRVSALRGAAVVKAVLRRGSASTAGGKVVLTLHLGTGALDASGIVPRNLAIAKGAAVIELWQGGIVSAIGRIAGSGVTATMHPTPNRVVVRLAASPGAFTALSVARTNGGRDVVLTLTPKPVVTTTTGNGNSTGSSTGSTSSGGTSSGGGNTTPPPTKTTTPPPTKTGGGLGNF